LHNAFGVGLCQLIPQPLQRAPLAMKWQGLVFALSIVYTAPWFL
jgi:hypothetical protein